MYNINLIVGWNLCSFNEENITFDKLIQNKNIIEIKSLTEFYSQEIPIELCTLNKLNNSYGYWIKCKENFTLELNDVEYLESITIKITKGWNLCGYSFKNNLIVDNLNDNIKEIRTTNKVYRKELPPEFNTLQELERNMGFFIKSDKDFNLVITNLSQNNKEDNDIYLNIENNDEKYKYMYNYDFNSISVTKINFFYNNEYFQILDVSQEYDKSTKILKFMVNTDKGIIELKLKKKSSIIKTIDINISILGGLDIINTTLINKNNKFKIYNNNSFIEIVLDWNGNLSDNIINVPIDINKNFLFWHNFKETKLDNIKIKYNQNNLYFENSFVKEESFNNYLILTNNIDDKCYIIILEKSNQHYNQIKIEFYVKNLQYNTILDYIDINTIILKNKEIALSNKYIIILDWNTNIFDNIIKNNVSLYNLQREEYLNLNSYQDFNINDFDVRVHYSVGDNNNSINLSIWNNYNNFLNSLNKIIDYITNFMINLGIDLPADDSTLKKNGGNGFYDIYVLNLGSAGLLGYTTAEFCNCSNRKEDLRTHMALNSNLDPDLLKITFIHEFFHALQANYDWFDDLWITEGMAVLFESILSNSEITIESFLPVFLKVQSFSLSYSGNYSNISNNGLITTRNLTIFNEVKSSVILKIIKLYSRNRKIDIFDNNNIFTLTDFNSENIIYEIKKDYKNNVLSVRVEDNSYSKEIDNISFHIRVNGELIDRIEFLEPNRYYSSFVFFYYIYEQYSNGNYDFFKYFFTNTPYYNSIDLIESILYQYNQDLNFEEVLVNFWISMIARDYSTTIDIYKFNLVRKHKYLLKNMEDTFVLNNDSNSFIINDLEPTGCALINLDYRTNNQKYISIVLECSEILNIEFKLLIINKNNNINVIDFNSNYINKKVDNNINEIKLIIIAKNNFPSNTYININIFNNNMFMDFFNIDYKIKVKDRIFR